VARDSSCAKIRGKTCQVAQPVVLRDRYYKQVAEAQADFIERNGLQQDVMDMTPDELQRALSDQLREER